MRSVLVAAVTAASAFAVIASSPATALDYPYCLQGDDPGYPGDCQFASRDECKAAASGRSADCGLNPAFGYRVHPSYGAYAGFHPDAYAYHRGGDHRSRW